MKNLNEVLMAVVFIVLVICALAVFTLSFFLYFIGGVSFSTFLLLILFAYVLLCAGIVAAPPAESDNRSEEEENLEIANMLNQPWR